MNVRVKRSHKVVCIQNQQQTKTNPQNRRVQNALRKHQYVELPEFLTTYHDRKRTRTISQRRGESGIAWLVSGTSVNF